MLRFINKNKVLALFAILGAFIPKAEAKSYKEMTAIEQIEYDMKEINGDWEVTRTQREHTVETTLIMSSQTMKNVPVIETVPETNSTTIMMWNVNENRATNQTVEVKGMTSKEYFEMMFAELNAKGNDKPVEINDTAVVTSPVSNALTQVESPVTNDVPVVTNTPAPVMHTTQTTTDTPAEESSDWKKGLVALLGMVGSFIGGYVLGKNTGAAAREQRDNRPLGPVAPVNEPLTKKEEKIAQPVAVEEQQKPIQKKPARVRAKLADLPSVPQLSMEELKKMGLVTAAELRKELLTIDSVSKNEVEKSFDETNPLPKTMKDKVLENIRQDREGQAERLKAVRLLAQIKAERKMLSDLMAKATENKDQSMVDEINSRRKALTVVKRDAFEQITGKYMGNIKEQRRLLAKEMTIARRRDDLDKMTAIMKQRQLLNQQEKELRTFVGHISYERDRKGLMKKATVDLIKNHHLADKREKRRLQDANRRAMKAIVAKAADQNKQLTR